MCYRHVLVFRDCRHQKSEVVTPCNQGFNEATQRCNANVNQGRMVTHDKPSYCPPCYRMIEEEICEAAEEMLLDIRTERQVMENFQAESRRSHEAERVAYKDNPEVLQTAIANYEEVAAEIVLWMTEGDEGMVEARNWRARHLKAFRDAQGVWGDG